MSVSTSKMPTEKMPRESVWDYPRPPRLEPSTRRVRVQVEDIWIADTTRAYRVLETSHPPTYYLPPEDVQMIVLKPESTATFCEWKGQASYYSLQIGQRFIRNVAWAYLAPTAPFSALAGYIAFYPSRVDACFIDEEQVVAQPGDFYGGWITSEIEGPFKGGPGTRGW